MSNITVPPLPHGGEVEYPNGPPIQDAIRETPNQTLVLVAARQLMHPRPTFHRDANCGAARRATSLVLRPIRAGMRPCMNCGGER